MNSPTCSPHWKQQLRRYALRPPHALLLTSRRFGMATQESESPEPDSGPETASEEALSAQEISLLADVLCGFRFGVDAQKTPSLTPQDLRHPDFLLVDPKRRSLRLEEIAPIFARICYPPQQAKKRLIIIERAQRLLPHTANALLKSIEEPMAETLFVLTAPSVAHIMPTIASRCMRLHLPMNQKQPSPLEPMEPQDVEFLRDLVDRIARLPATALLQNDARLDPAAAGDLGRHIGYAEALSKSLSREQLIAALLELVVSWRREHSPNLQAHLRADHQSDNESPGIHWLCSKLRAWQTSLDYNPSTVLRLCELVIQGAQSP